MHCPWNIGIWLPIDKVSYLKRNGTPTFSVVFVVEMFKPNTYCILIAGKEVTLETLTADKEDDICAKLEYSLKKIHDTLHNWLGFQESG